MKKRLTAYVLAMALACSCIPTAFATESEQAVPETTESAISSLYAEVPYQNGTLTVASANDSNVFEPEILSQAEHEKIAASGGDEGLAYSKNYSEEAARIQENGGTTTTTSRASSFTSYGAQLSNLQYQASGSSKKVSVGPAMKKLYDKYKADIQKGTGSLVFNYSGTEKQLAAKRAEMKQKLGVTLTVPSSYSDEQIDELAFDIGWIVYRCLDLDCPDMFYSNGYCYMYWDPNGTKLTVYLVPMFRAGFTSLSARKSLKTQLDNKVAEIVKEASVYTRAYDKITYFNSWLCAHNDYNYEAVSGSVDDYADNISGAPWSSVGAILSSSNSSVEGPVCESYSRAFQLLCSKVGIQATNVVSDSGWHMWNNVRYGNYWTGMDVTWYDSTENEDYFCETVNDTYGHYLDDADFYTWLTYPSLTAIISSKVLPYYDVADTFWGRDYIQEVYEKKYMVGTDCVTFGPNNKVTREQFVQILYSMEDTPIVSYEARFSDVPAGKWYTNAVMWASQNNVVSGYPNGTFGVGKAIRRQDLALMLYNYMNQPEAETVDLDERFVDADKISDYAYDAINWAVASGVMSGDNKGQLNPQGTATRAQTATMISKIA
ncbi:S-layer homology domain-containing protein [Butyricicoccus sp.]|uniref:S-layer homology domain-containing protein n=1 Tax=Butyricicoccus sp. TaxID=2049021 RepID=UPI003F140236